jgi:hypothetical protein
MKNMRILLTLIFTLFAATAAYAQNADDGDDRVLKPAEPDFTLISLPTSLRLPQFKSAFRVTHRFARPLTSDVGGLAGDLFGLDSGAQIGLEYRFGIVPNGEIGIHRSSDKTIEFFGQYGVVRQKANLPLDISALVSVDGTNNFRDRYVPALGAILSRRFGARAALYVEPMWVRHSNVQPLSGAEANDTFMVGLGARLRVRPTVSVVAESAPRVSGFRPGVNHGSVAIEKRAGGHVFQLNVSDSFATTMGQIARGGPSSRNWYLGFNISRKFF